MIKTLVLLLAFIRMDCFAQSSAVQDNYLCWDKNHKLKWRDFQARKMPFSSSDKLSRIVDAVTVPAITIIPILDSINVAENNFVVKVTFDRNKSWVRDSSNSTPKLLAHEQLHFDIAELFGRKLRVKIAQARVSKIDIFSAEFGKAIQSLMDEEGRVQDCYDAETWQGDYSHPSDYNQQIKWQNYISTELLKLEPYKSNEAICN